MLDHITHDEMVKNWAMLAPLAGSLPSGGRAIAEQVARKHGLTFNDIWQQDRRRHLVKARCEAWARIRAETILSLPQIGAIFNRDHTTILAGVHRWHDKWSKE